MDIRLSETSRLINLGEWIQSNTYGVFDGEILVYTLDVSLDIEASAAEGMDYYDFLAGADRYKTSLANGVVPLHWLEISPRWSVEGVLNGLHDFARAWRGLGRRP